MGANDLLDSDFDDINHVSPVFVLGAFDYGIDCGLHELAQ